MIQRYREALEAEIALVAARLEGPLRIARLHWGGGTPSILGTDGLASVIHVLSRHAVFEEDFEHAIELDPRYVTDDLARGLAALGVNRASLGVQDLDDRVQVAIGREQPLHVVEKAAAALRRVGIERLNIDLIYGLPHQSVEFVQATCAKVLALNPERVACYGYAHMPQRKANQRLIDETALPGREERFRQSQAVAGTFANGGYVAIGLDHFSRPDDPLAGASRTGRLHRNFQGYTDDDRSTLIALGASAISQLPGGYVQNVADIGTYLCHIAEGRLASARGYRLEADDKSRAAIIEALMCNFSVDLSTIAGPHDYADEVARLHPLVSDGIVTLKDSTIAVTQEGRPFVRLAAAVFDRFREADVARFSPAI